MKRILLFMMSTILLISFSSFVSAESNSLSLLLNGRTADTDVNPIIKNGRTLVPIRTFEAFNLELSWNSDEKKVTINNNNGGDQIELYLNQSTAYVNSVPIEIDGVPIIVDGRTLVPARFISETLEYDVYYVKEGNVVFIEDENAGKNLNEGLNVLSEQDRIEIIELIHLYLFARSTSDVDLLKEINITGGWYYYYFPTDSVINDKNDYVFQGISEVHMQKDDNNRNIVQIYVDFKKINQNKTEDISSSTLYIGKNELSEWKIVKIP